MGERRPAADWRQARRKIVLKVRSPACFQEKRISSEPPPPDLCVLRSAITEDPTRLRGCFSARRNLVFVCKSMSLRPLRLRVSVFSSKRLNSHSALLKNLVAAPLPQAAPLRYRFAVAAKNPATSPQIPRNSPSRAKLPPRKPRHLPAYPPKFPVHSANERTGI